MQGVSFSSSGTLGTARYAHTATVLQNGKVLVVGGTGISSTFVTLASAELYDPATGRWTVSGALTAARESHTATLLPNGKVLVAGGYDRSTQSVVPTAELYDPASGTWSAAGTLTGARYLATATLLSSGKVLLVGGLNGTAALKSAELYDPAGGTWSATGSLASARIQHTATLLGNGKVLVAGGEKNGSLATAELYDPASGTWSGTGSLGTARDKHTATLLPNGKVLVAAGRSSNFGVLASAELYDPAGGTWAATGSLSAVRFSHTASLLPNGLLFVAGGSTGSGSLASAEVYDFRSGTWVDIPSSLLSGRSSHTATLLPSGNVLLAGGINGFTPVGDAEQYDSSPVRWITTGSFTARTHLTATLLPNGKVLAAGGFSGSAPVPTAELYDPASGTWSATGSLRAARSDATATLLPNGKVLVAGGTTGTSGVTGRAEVYDPADGSWTETGSLVTARRFHTATLLPNGKVLVAGGLDKNFASLKTAELYDPASGIWNGAEQLGTSRHQHTATLLANGKVLVAGGTNGTLNNPRVSSELYDPATGIWTPTGDLVNGRFSHTGALLANGKVIIAGGVGGSGGLPTAELYDPTTGMWTLTASLNTGRDHHTATLLPNGKVLVAAGDSTNTAELFDPAGGTNGTWTYTGALGGVRYDHAATLLLNGQVLVAGGTVPSGLSGASLPTAEVYDVRFDPAWQPQIATAPTRLRSGAGLILTGSRLQGISQASGGNSQDSSSNYPIVQLRSLDSSQVSFLPVQPSAGWTDTTFTSTPVTAFPFGPALVTVFTNGIPSAAKYLNVVSNSAPVANSQSVITNEDTAVGVTLTASDSDNDGLSYTLVTSPAHGTLSGTAPNLSYTPAANYNGPDSFTFKANDGLLDSNSATVSITVNAVNDAPSFTKGPNLTTPPGSGPQTVTNWATNISAGPADESGQALTFILMNTDNSLFSAQPALSATGTLTYTPAGGTGTAGVSVTLKDNGGTANGGVDTSTTQIFTITISSQPTPTPTATPSTLANISTRLRVESGDNALIGGFIVTGTQAKKVIIRAIGPSLSVADRLANPTLELRNSAGTLLDSNDDWVNSPNKQAIIDSTIPPSNDLESAIVALLPANSSGYTAIVRGVNDTTGIGLVEAYDLDRSVNSKLANISTRGLVQRGDNVLIAGTIVLGQASQKVIIRGIGPSLSVPGKLGDPTLELRDSNGTLVEANDNWIDSPNKQAIIASTIPPTNDLESAIVATLNANGASYTAIVRGVNNTTGIALVEVYALK